MQTHKHNIYRAIVNIYLFCMILVSDEHKIKYKNFKSVKPLSESFNITIDIDSIYGINGIEKAVNNFGDQSKYFKYILDDCSIVYNHVWKYEKNSRLSGYHLGTDYSANNGSNVYAPINGYIIKADESYKNRGSINSTAGKWIAGSGNTIYMIGEVGDKIYGFIFMHLKEVQVNEKEYVGQGQVIALSGTSGKSLSPHCHLEMYYLGDGNLYDYIDKNYDATFSCGRQKQGYKNRCSNKKTAPCILNSYEYLRP